MDDSSLSILNRIRISDQAQLGVILLVVSSVLFGIVEEIGGRFDQAVARGDLGTVSLWGWRSFAAVLFLLGLLTLRAARRRLFTLGMTTAEARKAVWGWAAAGGLAMILAAVLGLLGLVESIGPGWHADLAPEPGARPMALAFAAYGVAGVLLFFVGAARHLLLRKR